MRGLSSTPMIDGDSRLCLALRAIRTKIPFVIYTTVFLPCELASELRTADTAFPLSVPSLALSAPTRSCGSQEPTADAPAACQASTRLESSTSVAGHHVQ